MQTKHLTAWIADHQFASLFTLFISSRFHDTTNQTRQKKTLFVHHPPDDDDVYLLFVKRLFFLGSHTCL
jgi:hypothetical protein